MPDIFPAKTHLFTGYFTCNSKCTTAYFYSNRKERHSTFYYSVTRILCQLDFPVRKRVYPATKYAIYNRLHLCYLRYAIPGSSMTSSGSFCSKKSFSETFILCKKDCRDLPARSHTCHHRELSCQTPASFHGIVSPDLLRNGQHQRKSLRYFPARPVSSPPVRYPSAA